LQPPWLCFTGTLTFLFLKNKYVRTPEGVPIGGKPNKANTPEDESDHAKFTMPNTPYSQQILLVVLTYVFSFSVRGIGLEFLY